MKMFAFGFAVKRSNFMKNLLYLLKFTYGFNKERITFLDIVLGLRSGKIIADWFIKPTDGHQYLHYFSAHPCNIKKSVIFSQTLHISELCGSQADFENHKEEIK